MDKNLLIFGHGYTAQALARRLVPLGWTIHGTTRNSENAEAVAASGARPVLWPGDDIDALLHVCPNILISAGPGPDGDPVLSALTPEIKTVAPRLRWLGYLSTTGVYGDHQGAWVNEGTPLTPGTERGAARVKAEAAWQAIPELPLHIFRLAGIYGPGRGPFAKVKNGTARRIIKKGQVFSRVHVDDIAQALALSLHHPAPGSIYNLCDDDPAPPQDVIAYAADLLGLPLPPAVAFEDADLSAMARSFYAESKKVSNDRAKAELGWAPTYPDYHSGLKAMLDQGADQADISSA